MKQAPWGRGSGVLVPDAARQIPESKVVVRCAFTSRSERYTMSELRRVAAAVQADPLHDPAVSRRAPAVDPPQDAVVDALDFQKRVRNVLRGMTPRQRRIVLAGLRNAGEPLSIVAQEVGLTRERVRQVMNQFRELLLGAPPTRSGPGRKRWRH